MNQSNVIKQPWLSLVRLVWTAMALYYLLPGLLGLPGYYRQLDSGKFKFCRWSYRAYTSANGLDHPGSNPDQVPGLPQPGFDYLLA